MRLKLSFLALALTSSVFTPAMAASLPSIVPAPAVTQPAPPPGEVFPPAVVSAVKTLGNGQAVILHVFPAPMNLLGVAMEMGGGRNMIMYTSQDAKYFIMGGIFGADGHNYTLEDSKKYLPAPPAPPGAGDNFAALSGTSSILWGKPSAKKEIWMLVDPNCIFCHKIYTEFKPFVDNGTVKVHVIPAGFLKPDSAARAAAILAAKNKVAAFIKDETGFDDATETGGIAPNTTDMHATELVKKNTVWMTSHGIGGTPYVLYLDKSGKPAVLPGFTPDAKGFLDGVK